MTERAAHAARETDLPSPGEIRKIQLALGVMGAPNLIVMDEPTNHLDLRSIECLEQALAGGGADLLLVSHDERLLETLCPRHWVMRAVPGGWALGVSQS